jgi:hypothetical protein
VVADAGLDGPDLVAGGEVPVGGLAAAAGARTGPEFGFLGQVAVGDGVPRLVGQRVGPADVGVVDGMPVL